MFWCIIKRYPGWQSTYQPKILLEDIISPQLFTYYYRDSEEKK
jgi:hypothetical protein